MDLISTEIKTLLDKLQMAIKIYDRAGDKIHNEPMQEQLKTMARRKKMLLEDLAKMLEINIDKRTLDFEDKIKVQWEKAGLELDNLLLRRNEKEALSFCEKRENELVAAYQSLIEDPQYDEDLMAIFRRHVSESSELLKDLQNLRDSYDFG